jgi:signal transduction histidine kinase
MMQPADSPRILLVDDTPTNLKVLAEALQGQGWKTLMAADGESALEQVAYRRPDLILLDVMMPGIDGFETCRRLKANPQSQDIPVIFMTALSDTLDRVRGLELGAVDYIAKPFQQEEVIARTKLHLRLSQLTLQLEQQVADRTAALTDSLHALQSAQLQLVQSEKMSTLGQMVSGIGHEINNPINFISGNLDYVDSYMGQLFRVIALYQQKFPADPEMAALHTEIDLPYLIADLPKLVRSMQSGATRLQDISLSLRTFSRGDVTNTVSYQVEEGIDSTVMLLGHRLKANEHRPAIQIIKQYQQVPPIECYPGQLNQVFMNLMANAIDALEEANLATEGRPIGGRPYADLLQRPNQITISTALNGPQNALVLRFKDNGTGIPEATQARIFEPSFTTKAVGKGTGLGLPISRQIITDHHHGQLECVSTVGEGTEFVITLPLARSLSD